MTLSFLKLQIKDNFKGSIFFASIRKTRKLEIERKKKELKWGAPDYKIYPSSLSTWSLCPKEFIKSLEQPTTIEDLTAVYRVKRGSAVHRELQEDLLNSDCLYELPQNIKDNRILNKLKNNWPEVPFHHKITGHSGSADGVIRYKDLPTVLEIKSTSIEPKRWEEYSEKMLPQQSHIIQVCNYIWHLNQLNYYGKSIERAIIAYINLLNAPGDQIAEKEFIVEYKDYSDKFETLIGHLTKHRQAYIDSVDLICSYPLCKVHK